MRVLRATVAVAPYTPTIEARHGPGSPDSPALREPLRVDAPRSAFNARPASLSTRFAQSLGRIQQIEPDASHSSGANDNSSGLSEWPPSTSVLGSADQIARFALSLLEG